MTVISADDPPVGLFIRNCGPKFELSSFDDLAKPSPPQLDTKQLSCVTLLRGHVDRNQLTAAAAAAARDSSAAADN